MEISKDQFDEWMENPVTKAYFRSVANKADKILQPEVDLESVEITALRAAYKAGIVHGLKEAIDVEFGE